MTCIHARASIIAVLLLQVAKTAAFSQRPYSNLKQSALQAASAIADVSDGWLSPQQIKTLRKEIDDRRRRKRLAYKRLHDGELAGDFDQATVDAADAALASSEFFEAGGPEKLNVKAWPAVAFALAEACDAMVVQLKKKKCVLYRPLPPGTPGAVVLRTTGKQIPWKARSPAVRDGKGRILGREEDFEDEEDAEDA